MRTGLRSKLFDDGFCVVPSILDSAMLGRLRVVARGILDSDPAAYAISKPMSIGYWIPEVHELIHWPAMHAAFDAIGIHDLRYYSAVLLNARPHEGPGGWHHDWWAWQTPEANRDVPPELAVFFYLVDTCRENGCLKVVPGTHRERSPWCSGFLEIATAEHPSQVDVPIKAGDMVLCDARVIHGRHGNQTEIDRPLVTLWFLPEFGGLSESVQAYAAGAVSSDASQYLDKLMPGYQGTTEKLKPDYSR